MEEGTAIQIQKKNQHPILRKEPGFQNPMQQMQNNRSHDIESRKLIFGVFYFPLKP
jgi:hypothetical protein